MKVLLVACNSPFSSGWHVRRALKQLGCSVRVFDYRSYAQISEEHRLFRFLLEKSPLLRKSFPILRKVNRMLINTALDFGPDLLLALKGEYIFPETIRAIKEELSISTALWFPDDPQLFESLSRHIAPSYDHVFTSSMKCIPKYKELGVKNVEYIAFACDPFLHRRVSLSGDERRRYACDLCFVGTWFPERSAILKHLCNFDLHIWGNYWSRLWISPKLWRHIKGSRRELPYPDMVKVFNASKIVLNVHRNVMKYGGTKANARVFEATGCGAFHLTDKPKGIEELFRIGKEIVCYRTVDELIELVNYYLNNPQEREIIAERGQKRAYKEHTYVHRVKRILSVAG